MITDPFEQTTDLREALWLTSKRLEIAQGGADAERQRIINWAKDTSHKVDRRSLVAFLAEG